MELPELNPWWKEKKITEEFAPLTYRDLYQKIEKDFKRRQIQIIVGLRRVGKSTIIFQLVNHLLKKNLNPLNIFYCTFDDPDIQKKNIEEVLKDYTEITGVDYKKEKVYLFLDEVQKSKDWVSRVKLIYDNLRNIKIVISGSASLSILSESKKSLAGRSIYYELRPLSFKEFLRLKNLEARSYLLDKEMIEKEFKNFIFRQFPEIIAEKDINFIKQYIRSSVIEPIILKDIPKEFGEVDILLLENLVNIFLTKPGQYLSVDELSRELGRAKKTLYDALFYLEFSFLTRKILNYRPSVRAASKKLSRVYAYHPCLTLPFQIPMENYVENLVLFELDNKYYWREGGKEVDALDEFVPVEVKYGNDVRKGDLKSLYYYLKKYGKKLKVKKAYVVTKDLEKKEDMICFVPLKRFCFEGLKK